MVKSSWVETEIKISKIRQRLDELFDKQKGEKLTSEEAAELAGILELNQIFTILNAKIINET